MSQNIIDEVMFLLHSLVMGAVITFVYDGFLIMRRCIRHSLLLISLEDMVFWMGCAIGVFFMLYEENNGILRWFSVLGAGIGMLLYKKSLSPFIVTGAAKLLSLLLGISGRLFHFLLRPLAFLAGKLKKGKAAAGGTASKIKKYLRKQLTAYRKILKIILCKH